MLKVIFKVMQLQEMEATLIRTFLKFFKHSSVTYGGSTVMNDRKITVGGSLVGNAIAGDNSTIKMDKNSSINSGKENDQGQDYSQLEDLINKLKAVIIAMPEIQQEDKEEAIKELESISKIEQYPKNEQLKKSGKKSLRFLKGLISELPTATKLVEECHKLLSAIVSLLGF